MEIQDPDQFQESIPVLLCIKCRQAGHVVLDCLTMHWPRDPFTWFFSEERRALEFQKFSRGLNQLCKRCEDLDVLQLLQKDLAWETTADLNIMAAKGTEKFRSIGKTGSVEFWDNCALCVCLFAMTPSPSSSTQDVLLLADWSMNRLAGETPTVTDLEGWSQFPKCLLVALGDDANSMEFNIKLHRGDALCIVEEDDPRHVLGGRFIAHNKLNIDIIKGWLSSCDQLHNDKCHPKWSEKLPHLKLVDVSMRKIVPAPQTSFDYLALSYVWGGVYQRDYHLGSTLEDLPQTIENAIALTRNLGKRYLWVDSLCIDQGDDEDKKGQIMAMQSIYSGAYVTLIALSGRSARAGLPRLEESKKMFPQLSCDINGKHLVGLMPTLSQQIWRAPWGKRAWTLQEALLAPRNLYLSDFQLYFECNGMQCCESLNDTRSWAHHLQVEANPGKGGWLASKVGDGCLRTPIDLPSHRLERYGSKLTLYSYRSMTNPMDGLNAFSGILKFLTDMYTEGFFAGLPIEDFQWGLLWRSQYPPTPRPGFPTWSWTGWQGGLWPTYPFDFTKPHGYPLHIRCWRVVEAQIVKFFETLYVEFHPNDPIVKEVGVDIGDPGDILQYPRVNCDNHLFIEAIMFDFIPDFSVPIEKVYDQGQQARFLIKIRGIRCLLQIMSMDEEVDREPSPEKQHFMFLARDYTENMELCFLHFLWVDFRDQFAIRRTVLDLILPTNHLEILGELNPRKRQIMMI